MSKNVVIVESPAKAKTIEKYLGKDFTVLSSVGHIRSIVKKTKDGTAPIDTKNGYVTQYEVDPEKKKVITELRKAIKGAEDTWLATDEDREGEAIAWHLCEVLKLDPKNTKRIVFHEITKTAIEAAIKSPRTVDMNLVQAQQARQILDRLVGFELSPVVWQKVPGGKSAGRVQSPAVRLLVEREREIDAFNGSYSFKVTAIFTIPEAKSRDATELKAELPKKFATEAEAQNFLESLLNAKFSVSDVTTSPSTRSPGPPFTTSSLQQEANSRLGFGAKATMSSAQKLYQEGKITYMRTDSVNLSSQALGQMTDYIKGEFGEQYHQFRTFKTKSASAQEAHEAIRPTDVRVTKGSSNEYDQKLYDLIRRRTLASQMAPAKLEKTTVTITVSSSKEVFEAKGEVIVFDGFLKVYGTNIKEDAILPPVASGDELKLQTANARQVFARPPARYTEGSLVKKLEELGIGRPSTYATIINTVQVRGYAVKGESEGTPRDVITLSTDKPPKNQEIKDVSESGGITRAVITEKTGSDRGKLVPTPAGMVVSDFLTNHFDQIVDYGFTADVEGEFDDIAQGKLERNKMLDEFYHPFHKLIKDSGGIDRASVAQAREVGIDPKTGKPILARFGRFGPMLQLGNPDPEDKDPANKPQFAPMPSGARIETVTLEQALEMFKLPRVVGTTPDGQTIKANIGRFGPYIQVDKTFVSIKPLDPRDITEAEARELYAEKLKKDAEKFIQTFDDGAIQVLNGRYGPYITDGKKNAKIPKDKDPKKLTRIECLDLLAATPDRKGGGFRRRAAAKK
jgi:DNA topoisomerase-1